MKIELRIVGGVTIPFPSAKLLLRMKQTYRDKDLPTILTQTKSGA